MAKYSDEWFELERILRPAAKREMKVDLRRDINWQEFRQLVLTGAIAVGCAMIEKAGRKGADDRTKVLYELRNALIHNSGDIAKNTNKSACQQAKTFLETQQNDLEPFFSLNGTCVELNDSVLDAIRDCLSCTDNESNRKAS